MPARSLLLWLPLLWLWGCSFGKPGEPAIGEAFVGPPSLVLREELGPRQVGAVTVKHGERLEIVGRRRRFLKVRTSSGAVGWVDGASLFTPRQMAGLQALAARAAQLPSQGSATVYGTANIHTHPSRQAPSFHQVREGDEVAIVAHRLAPRQPSDPEKPAPLEDWSLVRAADGKAGWALFRVLRMSIPDEVAQYAEGHRITSYFSLGEVRARGEIKHNWLWTTIAAGAQPYEFDSFRVFVWSQRRQHYETAYIERNLRGYYPVEVRPAGFSVIVEDKTGARYRRTYSFQGYHLRMVAKEPWNQPPPNFDFPDAPARDQPPEEPLREKSFFTRLLEKLK